LDLLLLTVVARAIPFPVAPPIRSLVLGLLDLAVVARAVPGVATFFFLPVNR